MNPTRRRRSCRSVRRCHAWVSDLAALCERSRAPGNEGRSELPYLEVYVEGVGGQASIVLDRTRRNLPCDEAPMVLVVLVVDSPKEFCVLDKRILKIDKAQTRRSREAPAHLCFLIAAGARDAIRRCRAQAPRSVRGLGGRYRCGYTAITRRPY